MEVAGKKAIEEACAASDETLLAATVSELVDGIMSEIDMDPLVLDWEGRHGIESGSGREIELQCRSLELAGCSTISRTSTQPPVRPMAGSKATKWWRRCILSIDEDPDQLLALAKLEVGGLLAEVLEPIHGAVTIDPAKRSYHTFTETDELSTEQLDLEWASYEEGETCGSPAHC